MQRPTKKDMLALIEHWQSLVPRRPLTYGEHLQWAREQAYHVRALADENEPAINLIWLFEQIVIPVQTVPSYTLNENSGLTTDRVEGRLQIFINENEPHLRQRFTLLHEFKHALDFPDNALLYHILGSGDEKIQRDQIEAIANDFAAHVLMPTQLVKHVWFDTRNIDQAATIFRVSREAMRRRLDKLGLLESPKPQPRDLFRVPGTIATDQLSYTACAM